MSRGAARALAVAALLAVAAAVVVVVLGAGDGGKSPATSGAGSVRSPGQGPRRGPTVASGTEVRNARPQPDWRPHHGPVPIFRYHAIGEAGPEEGYAELFVPAEDFSDQMDWLAEHGYEAVGLETVERAWFDGGTLPAKPVVLSFDGVEGDLARAVVPDLRRRGWPGVLVLDPDAASADAGEVASLVAIGWELEAEGDDPATSRAALESEFATPVGNFAFAQGRSADPGEAAALARVGYEGATMTGYGFAESRHRFDQPRITIFGLSGVDGFVEALRSRGGGVGA